MCIFKDVHLGKYFFSPLSLVPLIQVLSHAVVLSLTVSVCLTPLMSEYMSSSSRMMYRLKLVKPPIFLMRSVTYSCKDEQQFNVTAEVSLLRVNCLYFCKQELYPC